MDLPRSVRLIPSLTAFLAACGPMAITPLAAADRSVPAQPNIIVILADDLGYGDVGAFFQNKRAALHDRHVPSFSTPHLDALAASGAMLTQHYCGAPVCAPSRASFLTGLTQGHANVRDSQFDKAISDTHTLGSTLHQAGYATAAFGKWGLQGGNEPKRERVKNGKPPRDNDLHTISDFHFSNTPYFSQSEITGNPASWPAFPTKRGFDYFFGLARHSDGHFQYPKEDDRQVWDNDAVVTDGLDLCYSTDLLTARTKKWIVDQRSLHTDKPFFTYLAFTTPHAILQNPPCPYPPGGGLKGGVQWLGKPHQMINAATGSMDGYMHPDIAQQTWDDDRNPATPEVAWPDVQKRYANGVRRIDDAVGDIMQLLKDLDISDNTLIVFTSDNGPSHESYLPDDYDPDFFHGFGPFDGIKRDSLEGGVRMPTIVSWPKAIPSGKVVTRPSGQWDWLPTFVDAAGLTPPAGVDGVSLIPTLTGQGNQLPGIVYCEHKGNEKTPGYEAFLPQHRNRERGQMQSIYIDGFKGIRYNVRSANDPFEIYDVVNDPQESKDLFKNTNDPRMVQLQAAMQARVLQVRMPNESTPRPYDAAPVPPTSTEKPGITGLRWDMYPGTWPWMPDFRTLTSTGHGSERELSTLMIPAKTSCGLTWNGFFHAETTGSYTFTVKSDTGAMLFIHDCRVIDEPIRDSAGTYSGTINLAAGWHPLRLLYRHVGGKAGLQCTVNREGDKPQPLAGDLISAPKSP